MASNGNGTTAHVAGELFKLMTGVEMVHVPYRGPEPAMTDLLAGKVQVIFGIPSSQSSTSGRASCACWRWPQSALGSAPGHTDSGRIRAGIRGERIFWARCARKKRPLRSSASSTDEINAALSDLRIRARLAEVGGTVFAGRQPNSASSLPTKPRSGAR